MDDTERLEQIEAELITRRLAQIDDHIAALLAESLKSKSLELDKALEPVKTIETAQKNEGVTCGHDAPKILTNTPYKKYNDRTIYSNAPSK